MRMERGSDFPRQSPLTPSRVPVMVVPVDSHRLILIYQGRSFEKIDYFPLGKVVWVLKYDNFSPFL